VRGMASAGGNRGARDLEVGRWFSVSMAMIFRLIPWVFCCWYQKRGYGYGLYRCLCISAFRRMGAGRYDSME
jgi:hypothetical protein